MRVAALSLADFRCYERAELSFPERDEAHALFRAIGEEARSLGVDDTDPAAFVLLAEAGRALREMRGPEEAVGRLREHGALLYHLYHSWKAGDPVYLLDSAVLRLLVESGPWSADPPPRPPCAGAYLQLPRHLVWVRAHEEDDAPESVDGLFWTVGAGRITFLLVMGIRPDRPGFSVAPLEPLPLEQTADWLEATMREAGGDFSATLPGAELERLYELRTAGEVLKLASRMFRYLTTAPDAALVEVEAGEAVDRGSAGRARSAGDAREAGSAGSAGRAAPGDRTPKRSSLPFIRVTLAP